MAALPIDPQSATVSSHHGSPASSGVRSFGQPASGYHRMSVLSCFLHDVVVRSSTAGIQLFLGGHRSASVASISGHIHAGHSHLRAAATAFMGVIQLPAARTRLQPLVAMGSFFSPRQPARLSFGHLRACRFGDAPTSERRQTITGNSP